MEIPWIYKKKKCIGFTLQASLNINHFKSTQVREMMELFANLSAINCTSVLGHLKLEAERAQIKISITQQANIREKVKEILNATCYII